MYVSLEQTKTIIQPSYSFRIELSIILSGPAEADDAGFVECGDGNLVALVASEEEECAGRVGLPPPEAEEEADMTLVRVVVSGEYGHATEGRDGHLVSPHEPRSRPCFLGPDQA